MTVTTTTIVLAVLLTLLTFVIALFAARVVWVTRLLCEAIPPVLGKRRPVSLTAVLPAGTDRSELERCLRSLAAQDVSDLRVQIVDPSLDAALVKFTSDFNRANPVLSVSVVRAIDTSPTGAKKPSEWLLLTHPRNEFDPSAIASAVAFSVRRKLDLLTLIGRPKLMTLWERIIQPVVFQHLSLSNPIPPANDPALPSVALAFRDFLLVRTTVFEAAEGNQGDRLVQRAKAGGLRTLIADGRKLFRITMGRDRQEIEQSWFTLLRSVIGRRPGLAITAGVLVLLTSVAPFAILLVGAIGSLLQPGVPEWTMAGLVGLSQVLFIIGSRRPVESSLGITSWTALLHPVGGIVLAGLFFDIARNPVRTAGKPGAAHVKQAPAD